MKREKKIILSVIIALVGLILMLVLFLRLRYGGGDEYHNFSTEPRYDDSQLDSF